MQPSFRDYAERVVRTARALAAGLADEGLRLVSGGTDSHLALVDLQPIGMTGDNVACMPWVSAFRLLNQFDAVACGIGRDADHNAGIAVGPRIARACSRR